MKLQFWGAAQTVTGSMHLVEVGEKRLLLDCGMYQGRRKKAFEINRNLPFDAASIDAVVLSHAHIDHSGNLPSLVRAGFAGKIYCTDPTRDLAARMLLDSAKIQEGDVKYVNKRRKRDGRRLFEPLYQVADALETTKRFVSIGYNTPFEPLPGVRGEFFDAGHMLGSASVALDVTEANKTRRLVFSGDIGRERSPILRGPDIVPDADFLIMECTYGNREHSVTAQVTEELREAVEETLASGGKLIIPAFSVGRTQEIVYRLNEMWEAGELRGIRAFVDSPLAIDITEIFRLHTEYFDREMQEAILREDDGDPLGFRHLHYCRSVEQSRELNNYDEPIIIIAASGMCEAGRVLHHLKNHIEKPSTTILFSGFQAHHTLGRKILEGVSPVPIFGKKYENNAKIRKIGGLSAHADRSELLDWTLKTQHSGDLKRVMLVHGEVEPAEALAEGLQQQGVPRVDIPKRGEEITL